MASSWLFPSGRHFNPTDDELLLHLLNYVTGQPFSCRDSILIPTVDLYGDEEPWVLFSKFSSSSLGIKKKRDLYFYTRLKKKSQTAKGKRVSRVIGKGSWHGQDCGKKIFYQGKGLLGFKKSLLYQNQKNPTHNGQWLLKEYSLSANVVDEIEKKNLMGPQLRDYVLCRMRWKKPKKVKSEASNQQVVTGDLSDLFSKFQDKMMENFCSPSPQQEIQQFEVSANLCSPSPQQQILQFQVSANLCSPSPHQDILQFQEKMISPNLYYSQSTQQEILQFQDKIISANLLSSPKPQQQIAQFQDNTSANLSFPSQKQQGSEQEDTMGDILEFIDFTLDDELAALTDYTSSSSSSYFSL